MALQNFLHAVCGSKGSLAERQYMSASSPKCAYIFLMIEIILVTLCVVENRIAIGTVRN